MGRIAKTWLYHTIHRISHGRRKVVMMFSFFWIWPNSNASLAHFSTRIRPSIIQNGVSFITISKRIGADRLALTQVKCVLRSAVQQRIINVSHLASNASRPIIELKNSIILKNTKASFVKRTRTTWKTASMAKCVPLLIRRMRSRLI